MSLHLLLPQTQHNTQQETEQNPTDTSSFSNPGGGGAGDGSGHRFETLWPQSIHVAGRVTTPGFCAVVKHGAKLVGLIGGVINISPVLERV